MRRAGIGNQCGVIETDVRAAEAAYSRGGCQRAFSTNRRIEIDVPPERLIGNPERPHVAHVRSLASEAQAPAIELKLVQRVLRFAIRLRDRARMPRQR